MSSPLMASVVLMPPFCFFFPAEDGIRDGHVTGVQTCALPISRIYPVGRLDKASEGLILLTDDGEIVNKILRSRNDQGKEYIVRVNKPVTPEFIKGMGEGVPILDTVTKKCEVRKTGSHEFHIILTQGLNRQIRRMCEYFNYEVVGLKRIRVINIHLDDLPVGKYRHLSEKELKDLKRIVEA